jgi:hypothetical protein
MRLAGINFPVSRCLLISIDLIDGVDHSLNFGEIVAK